VLGTHFNVNAYENEERIHTTLLEGSVRVSAIGPARREQSAILKPGEQAALTHHSSRMAGPIADSLTIYDNIDVRQVIAWKNGLFNFEGVGLQEAMRQLERWYDIEVVYEKGVPNITFGGKMTKNVSLKGMLIGLEKTEVHFRVEGRKLIVLP